MKRLRKYTKRITSTMLAAAMLATMLPFSAVAYALEEDKDISITWGEPEMSDDGTTGSVKLSATLKEESEITSATVNITLTENEKTALYAGSNVFDNRISIDPKGEGSDTSVTTQPEESTSGVTPPTTEEDSTPAPTNESSVTDKPEQEPEETGESKSEGEEGKAPEDSSEGEEEKDPEGTSEGEKTDEESQPDEEGQNIVTETLALDVPVVTSQTGDNSSDWILSFTLKKTEDNSALSLTQELKFNLSVCDKIEITTDDIKVVQTDTNTEIDNVYVESLTLPVKEDEQPGVTVKNNSITVTGESGASQEVSGNVLSNFSYNVALKFAEGTGENGETAYPETTYKFKLKLPKGVSVTGALAADGTTITAGSTTLATFEPEGDLNGATVTLSEPAYNEDARTLTFDLTLKVTETADESGENAVAQVFSAFSRLLMPARFRRSAPPSRCLASAICRKNKKLSSASKLARLFLVLSPHEQTSVPSC